MSSDRVTVADVRRAVERHHEVLIGAGLIDPTDRLELETGSRTYGRAWRLARIPAGQTGHYRPTIGDDYLGQSAREAYDTVTARTRTIWDVFYVLGERHSEVIGWALGRAIESGSGSVRKLSGDDVSRLVAIATGKGGES